MKYYENVEGKNLSALNYKFAELKSKWKKNKSWNIADTANSPLMNRNTTLSGTLLYESREVSLRSRSVSIELVFRLQPSSCSNDAKQSLNQACRFVLTEWLE